MLKLIAIGALVAALAHPLTVDDPPPEPPPNDRVVVDVVTVNGSGCRAGTAAVAVSPDSTSFVVTYSEYLAQVGVGALPTDLRKNCQLSLVVHVPQGFTWALTSIDLQGFASLADGAVARYRTSSYFQGQSQTAFRSYTVTGPVNDDVLISDGPDIASMIWAPCGALRNFNINTEIRVSAGTSDTRHTTSFASIGQVSGFTFRLAPCPRR